MPGVHYGAGFFYVLEDLTEVLFHLKEGETRVEFTCKFIYCWPLSGPEVEACTLTMGRG